MSATSFTVQPLEPSDHQWVEEAVRHWGGTNYVISRGRVLFPSDLPGFRATGPDGLPLGLAVYEVAGGQCQLVLLEAFKRFSGIGTALIAAVLAAAAAQDCERLWLVTTNDNLEALRFYQRRGFEVVAVHRDLRDVARRLKPSLPLRGEFGIPICSEVELETRLP